MKIYFQTFLSGYFFLVVPPLIFLLKNGPRHWVNADMSKIQNINVTDGLTEREALGGFRIRGLTPTLFQNIFLRALTTIGKDAKIKFQQYD